MDYTNNSDSTPQSIITTYILRTVSTLAYLLLILSLSAQGLRIGQPMPDITFTRLINTEQKELSLSSLKGKNVILYNYAIYCAPCINKFPIFNKIRDNHREDLEIILLSDGKHYDRLVKIFEIQRESGRNITLIQAAPTEEDYKQLELAKEYNGFSGGYTWIDKEGNYQGTSEINEENVAHFIKYGTLKENMKTKSTIAPVVKNFEDVDNSIRQQNFAALKECDPDKPLLFAQEGKNIRSGSIFTGYNPNYPDRTYNVVVVMKDNKPIGLRTVNMLHSMGYRTVNSYMEYDIDSNTNELKSKKYRKFENSFINPETKQEMRVAGNNMDSLLYAKGFCYELILPEDTHADIPTLLTYMLNDLDRYYGLKSKIEMKKCLALVEIEKGKTDIKSRYKNSSTQRNNFSVSIRNGKIEYLTSAIDFFFITLVKNEEYAYILDHTGIDYNIDLEITADMTNLSSIRKALNKVGLDLIETEAIGEVCVISDH